MGKSAQDMLDEVAADHEAAMRRYKRLRAAGLDATPPKPLASSLKYRYVVARLNAEQAAGPIMAGTTRRKNLGQIVGRR